MALPPSGNGSISATFSIGLGDLVAHRATADRAVVQVVGIEADGRLRVRGLEWPAGYSALLPASEVAPVAAAYLTALASV